MKLFECDANPLFTGVVKVEVGPDVVPTAPFYIDKTIFTLIPATRGLVHEMMVEPVEWDLLYSTNGCKCSPKNVE